MSPPTEPPGYAEHFGALAARYDELRRDPSDENIDVLVREGDLAGRSVLDIGCGTGRVAGVLSGRYGATVHGVEPSEQMLAVARERVPAGVRLTQAGAERLPFADGAFERALMQLVVHLTDRPAALAEARRVLAAAGRLVICSVDPAGAERFWLSDLFPSYAGIERGRFPSPRTLRAELEVAGFPAVADLPFEQPIRYSRRLALDLLRGRFASSFALIDDDEYAAGMRRAERELPDPVQSVLKLIVVVARCG
jgi:SAM-dependent methyltransferase